MAETCPGRDPARPPSHPGELLSEVVLPATGWSQTETTSLPGLSRRTLHDILSGRAPATASTVETVLSCGGRTTRGWAKARARSNGRDAQEQRREPIGRPTSSGRLFRLPRPLRLGLGNRLRGDIGSGWRHRLGRD